jgi:linoleate 8R-lipoxygenase/9,12-octadecadienoate 8-hydroperoxide 8R-isomerase
MAIFMNHDPVKSFPLLQAARTATQQLGQIVLGIIGPMDEPTGVIGRIIEKFHQHTPLSNYGAHMIEQLLKHGMGVDELVWTQLLPTSGGMVANQAQLFAQCLDFYLSDEGAPHLKEIHRLAKLDTDDADELILR